MRIISGALGGRNFDAPPGHRTHPMSDKMRGALFNMLGDIQGLSVLDAFAGSGALSFEAISRGAESVLAVEVDKTAFKVIESNARTLNLDKKFKVIKANVASWSRNNLSKQFDIVLADPPYDNTQTAVLQKLAQHVKKEGLLVLSWPGHTKTPDVNDLNRLVERTYGDSQLVFYRKTP